MMRDAWLVYAKELTDALRDRRTLLMVLLSSVAIGPLVLMLVSSMVAGMEQRAEAREIMVQGLEHPPSLRNYLPVSYTHLDVYKRQKLSGELPISAISSFRFSSWWLVLRWMCGS